MPLKIFLINMKMERKNKIKHPSPSHLNKYTIIKFICRCGKSHSKTFEDLYKTGGFCEQCTEYNRINNIVPAKFNT